MAIPLKWRASVSSAFDNFRVVYTIWIEMLSYDIIRFFCLIDGLFQFHQLSFLLPDEGHAFVDLSSELRHATFDGREVVSVDAQF